MAFRERIEVVVDFITGKAGSSIKSFRSELAQTDGAFGKMQVASGRAKDFITQNAGSIATAAGGALVAFGLKSVSAFQDTALAAGKFSDAAGIAVEDASRWMEVAGDLGVEGDKVAGAINRMNRAAASGDLAKFGVDVATTASGAVDVNETFLNVIDRLREMKDPTERAAAAQALLGKSWTDLAEVINDPNLRKNLANVSDAKVIDREEVEKARRFREAMDNLKDSFEDVQMAAGELLVPELTRLANILQDVKEKADAIPGGFETLNRAAKAGAGPFSIFAEGVDLARDSLGKFQGIVDAPTVDEMSVAMQTAAETAGGALTDGFEDAAEAAGLTFKKGVDDARQAAKDAAREVTTLDLKIQALRDELSANEAMRQFTEDLNALKAEGGNTAENLDKAKGSALDLYDALDELMTQAQQKSVLLSVESGQLDDALLKMYAIRQAIDAINNTVIEPRASRSGVLTPTPDGARMTAAQIAAARRSGYLRD